MWIVASPVIRKNGSTNRAPLGPPERPASVCNALKGAGPTHEVLFEHLLQTLTLRPWAQQRRGGARPFTPGPAPPEAGPGRRCGRQGRLPAEAGTDSGERADALDLRQWDGRA